jgi:hypothetical protein
MTAFLCACGTDTEFASNHFNELQKDCGETLACNSGSLMIAASDALQQCVDQAGDMLSAASESKQGAFLDTVNRCAMLQVCDYLSCTRTNPNVGYAQIHQQQIQYDCTQTIACRISAGQPQPANAVDQCISQNSNTLNFATQQTQVGFEAKFVKCVNLVGCAWTNCI